MKVYLCVIASGLLCVNYFDFRGLYLSKIYE